MFLDRKNTPRLIAVTGLAFEARIIAGPGIRAICGGDRAQLSQSLEAEIRRGCDGVLSFGIAGGLAPHLKPGACIVARHIIAESGRYSGHAAWSTSLMDMTRNARARRAAPLDVSFGDIAGSDVPVSSAKAKWRLHEAAGALTVDMESHVAAEIAAAHLVPFAAFRVVTDPSDRDLPPAALSATDAAGRINASAILRSLARRPAQVPALVRLALDSWAARRALVSARRLLGPHLGFPDLGQHGLDVT